MFPSRRQGRIGRLTLALAVVCPAGVSAQLLPQETVSLVGGRLTLGGEVTATVAPDDTGQFNYTDYERSALQLLRLGITASFRPLERIALVTELRVEGDTDGGPWTAVPFAAYVRVRPWKDRPFDIQAGRIPPVFGAAGRRIYANDNVLIGYPLAWQYLTVLRSEAAPSGADELIYARATGLQPEYSVGTPGYARGVPLASAFRYDSGVQARVGGEHQRVSVAAALTAGTLSSPGARATNGGPQVSTRLAVRPATGVILGGSFADGRFFANDFAKPSSPGDMGYGSETGSTTTGHYHQQTWGADAEYSLGYFLARAELVTARWRLPAVGTAPIDEALRSTGVSVEGRYRLAPGITAGGRVDRLSFSQLRGRYEELPWDAPLTRVEAGVAWSATRNLIVRGSVQHNNRSRGRVRSSTLPALQVTVWF
jgi:hypothetical protein